MKFECSQCLAAAIESHRLDLVRQLLQRPVGYPDVIWMPCPRAWKPPYSFCTKKPEWGQHPLSQDVGIAHIDSAVCENEVFDEEICTPGVFTRYQLDNANRILASRAIEQHEGLSSTTNVAWLWKVWLPWATILSTSRVPDFDAAWLSGSRVLSNGPTIDDVFICTLRTFCELVDCCNKRTSAAALQSINAYSRVKYEYYLRDCYETLC